jgi:hypothetical protein
MAGSENSLLDVYDGIIGDDDDDDDDEDGGLILTSLVA